MIVFLMCAHKSDVGDAGIKVEFDDESERVALDVKNYAVLRSDV